MRKDFHPAGLDHTQRAGRMKGEMAPLRVGVIGAGPRAAVAHLPGIALLQQAGEVNLVAICDLDERRLAVAADRYGVGAAGR